MSQLFDEKGNLVEAFTEEEVQKKIEEETEKLVEETNSSRQEEIDALQEKLDKAEQEKATLEEKITKVDDKTINFKNLREKAETKDKVIEELTKKIGDLESGVNQKIDQITGTFEKQKISNLILQLAGGNKELADKIEVSYNRFAGKPKDETELKSMLQDAYILATGDVKKSFLSGGVISAAGGTEKKEGETKLSGDMVDLSKKFGVTDQDLKKHKLI